MDLAAQGDDMDETDIQYVLGRHFFLKKDMHPKCKYVLRRKNRV